MVTQGLRRRFLIETIAINLMKFAVRGVVRELRGASAAKLPSVSQEPRA